MDIFGANWFGAETEAFCVHGLWVYSLVGILDAVHSQGVNMLRIPVSGELALQMDTIQPTTINYKLNPDLRGKSAGQVMDTLFAECAKRRILVMPEFHKFTHKDPISELWYRDPDWPETRVVQAWLAMVRRWKSNPWVFAVDLKNEPHGAATWRTGNRATDWADACERMGNAVLAENPALLVFVAGLDRSTKKPEYGEFWGGVLDDVEANPVRLSVPNRVVYTPHVYGPDVFMMDYFSKDKGFPANMPAIWEAQWAYIARKRLACVFVGELGGRCVPGTLDAEWHNALADFISGLPPVAGNFAVWAVNPNSADTKGILLDDWKTPDTNKIRVYARMRSSSSSRPPPAPAGGKPPNRPAAPAPALAPQKPSAPAGGPSPPNNNNVLGLGRVSCTARWVQGWSEGPGKFVAKFEASMVNSSSTPVPGNVRVRIPDGLTMTQSWSCSVVAPKLLGLPAWTSAVPANGGKWDFGFIAQSSAPIPERGMDLALSYAS